MAKYFRRSIRIAGKLVSSDRFTGKNGKQRADDWYKEKKQEKDFIEGGLMSSDAPTFKSYSTKWFLKRQKSNPQSTWAADETRLRQYLLPSLSAFPLNRITRQQMREVLQRAKDENNLSIATRGRIKALASKIFSDALNENPPLVMINPCAGLKFQDAREGKKRPPTLQDGDEVLQFLRCAATIGKTEALVCAVAVMAGLRKSEIIPLRYKNILSSNRILVDHHCEQASLSIKEGTKAGSEEIREVAIPQNLVSMIVAYRKESPFNSNTDFIFCDEEGDWIRPRKLHTMIDAVVKEFGRPITLHKLRHSYGRIFMTRTGNQQALKDILGHKSLSTTVIYSELSGEQLQPFGEMMNFEAPKLVNVDVRVKPKRRHKEIKGD